MGNGRGADACFIGETGAAHALYDDLSDSDCGGGSAYGRAIEGVVENHPDHMGHLIDLDDQHGDGAEEVNDPHERNEFGRDVADAFDAANEHQGGHDHDGHSGGKLGHLPGVFQDGGDLIGLEHVGRAGGGKDAADGEEDRQGLE